MAKYQPQTYQQVITALQAGRYQPMYFLFGDEPYYIDLVSDYIEQNALDEVSREFDQVLLYGKDIENGAYGEAVMQARSFAMMGGKKVVIVKEAQLIKDFTYLIEYAKHPSPQSVLVVCHKKTLTVTSSKKEEEQMKNLPFMLSNQQGVVVMQSEPIRDYEMPKWIDEYIAQWNQSQRSQDANNRVMIDPKVTALLAENLGNDLTKIVGALRKLIDGRPPGENLIDANLVERNIGISKDFNIFELQEALVKGNALKANRIVRYFATSKNHPIIKELPVLFNFFANLMLYHYHPKKADPQAVAADLKINPYIFRLNYVPAAQRFSAGKTFRIIGYFRDIDARSKGMNSGSADELDLWMELIYKILH